MPDPRWHLVQPAAEHRWH